MSETDTPDDNQISDDDWAAAMQEQAAAEGLTDTAEPALGDESPSRPSPPASSSPISGRPAPRAAPSTTTT
jgi:flagellar motor switch protein FliN/FliY